MGKEREQQVKLTPENLRSVVLQENADEVLQDHVQEQLNLDNLHRAILQGSADDVQGLLAKRASLEQRDEAGFTPLGRAAQAGNCATAEVLIRAGAGINVKPGPDSAASLEDDTEVAPIFNAKDGAMVRLLATWRADLCARSDYSGVSPLHCCAADGRVDALRALLDLGCSCNSLDRESVMPLSYAIEPYDVRGGGGPEEMRLECALMLVKRDDADLVSLSVGDVLKCDDYAQEDPRWQAVLERIKSVWQADGREWPLDEPEEDDAVE